MKQEDLKYESPLRVNSNSPTTKLMKDKDEIRKEILERNLRAK
jgi:hypothetical protein